MCVGETLAQREAGQTEAVVRGQVEGALTGLVEELRETVIAYEDFRKLKAVGWADLVEQALRPRWQEADRLAPSSRRVSLGRLDIPLRQTEAGTHKVSPLHAMR